MGSLQFRAKSGWVLRCIMLFEALWTQAQASISSVNIETNQWWVYLESNFRPWGLDPGATIGVDLNVSDPSPNVHFVVITWNQWKLWQADYQRMESLVRRSHLPNLETQSAYKVVHWRAPLAEHFKAKFTVVARQRDRYMIGILNPNVEAVRVVGNLSVLNPNGEQLQVQDGCMPLVLDTMTVFFGTLLFGYTAHLLFIARKPNKTKMHALLFFVLLLTVTAIICYRVHFYQVKKFGREGRRMAIFREVIHKAHQTAECILFLLIALGYKFLRPTLNRSEIRVTAIMSTLSLWLGVAQMVRLDAISQQGYILSRHVLHCLIFLIVIVATNFNLSVVQANLLEAPASPESGQLYRRWIAYKNFRWIFLAFILAPNFEAALQALIIPWDAAWFLHVVVYTRTGLIYSAIIFNFSDLPFPSSLKVFEILHQGGGSDESGRADEVEPTEIEPPSFLGVSPLAFLTLVVRQIAVPVPDPPTEDEQE